MSAAEQAIALVAADNIAVVEVRSATVDDADGVAAVHVESWRGAYATLLPQPLLDSLSVQARAQQWRAQLRDSRASTFVAVDESAGVVGFASVGPCRDPEVRGRVGELYAIYLIPRLWGAGVGRALHDVAVETLASEYSSATLWVLAANTRARSFYERLRWVADGAVTAEQRDGFVLHEVRYRRDLEG